MTPRIGSLCTGYGGLDMAVQAVFGGTVAWVSDIDPGARQILAHRHPDVPNIGDLTTANWADIEPVDIVCGGYPCQPFSSAGLRKGIEDERHIWPFIASALGVLRPRYAIFENVSGHLRRGFDTVLADLAGLGFDVEWACVRASEVGAPHPRQRLFILATAQDADSEPRHQRRVAAPGQAESRWARSDAGGRSGTPAADSEPDCPTCGCPEWKHDAGGFCAGCRNCADPELGRPDDVAADAGSGGRQGNGELPAGRNPIRGGLRHDADGRHPAAPADANGLGWGPAESHLRARQPDASWGRFGPAIRRWEAVTGRPAPRATDVRGRLAPTFVEWMQGIPAGHVTDVPGLNGPAQLKALGNGVVPQQATAALRLLLARTAARTEVAA